MTLLQSQNLVHVWPEGNNFNETSMQGQPGGTIYHFDILLYHWIDYIQKAPGTWLCCLSNCYWGYWVLTASKTWIMGPFLALKRKCSNNITCLLSDLSQNYELHVTEDVTIFFTVFYKGNLFSIPVGLFALAVVGFELEMKALDQIQSVLAFSIILTLM